jgi:hypothetical protein
LFYLHVGILHHGYNRVNSDIMVFTTGFCKCLHLDSSTYLCATVVWPPHIHRIISKNHRKSTSDIFQSLPLILSCAMLSLYVHIKGSVGTPECDSQWFSLIVRWICIGHAKIVQWCFICGEEFQRVGRTIFIKNASFCLYINNFNPDFQNFDFFYQVIVLLRWKY